MKVIVGVDDTDNKHSEKGTGRLLTSFIKQIKLEKGIEFFGVVRHQLYKHPDIPYTSHNSAMSVLAEVAPNRLALLTKIIPELLVRDSAEGSDPGFCLALTEQVKESERLISFGQRAKKEILTKESAYSLAKSLNIHLSEHGGSGHGVIGALAGVGLRLSGNDGRFRGKYHLGEPGAIIKVKDLMELTEIELVQDISGATLAQDDVIMLGEKIKGVLINNKKVLLVIPVKQSDNGAGWQTCPMDYLRAHF